MTFAEVDDVLIDLGRQARSEEERKQIESWLAQAEAIIKSRLPNLNVLVNTGRLDEAVVAMVEVWVVARKVKNPDGKQNERVDDYSYGLDQDARRGAIFLTDEEWDLLIPRAASDSFTVRFRATPGFAHEC